ncbi:hypothetical protein NEUTE1DRAFT_55652 [Neurospora tetrasperma FGSC 2508]|uniref:Uncharacterized protein n=1 Tax=Neurospora tetrasperma (strain FGSC 2508 / ATCC MYA-4615 / P0657) TaxID=510951 RepID=F8N1Y8_NEUT8|nr:uncharacterized protein NEUTE1DRAFT_55652 [Neurospora tetrasperma FGSC 2508]EGO53212.1 hypothetical protein NEUTE1DRAFT_55652 [Neurospora tetrasperma FGSC 2508]
MSATIDRYIHKATLLKNKVDILLNKDILSAMLPVQMTVRIDNVIAHFQIWRTVLPEKLSVARRDYFAQGAMKYSTNEWIKVGLLLDEIEMTLNRLVEVGSKLGRTEDLSLTQAVRFILEIIGRRRV